MERVHWNFFVKSWPRPKGLGKGCRTDTSDDASILQPVICHIDFFPLSVGHIYLQHRMRQFIFSVCACVVAVGLYFLLKPYVGTETVSWMCILGAAPFAALGFIKYNGMTAEKFVWAWFKSEFLMPKKLTFRSTNTYYEMMKPEMERKQKEVLKTND